MAIGIAMVRVIPCAWYQEKSQGNCGLSCTVSSKGR